jgi:medium-chain acyl-[acyl-carrier-protein] hydrolase
MFRDWPSGLPDDVEVHAVCLPGRGRRASEPAAASMDELVAALCSVARPLLDRPYAIFGHSFGALVGFELAGALERAGHAAAQRLFVSGCAAPDEISIGPMVHQLSDAELAEVMRALSSTPSPALQDAGVLATTLALFRADLKLAELHRPSAAPLAAPLTAYFGSADLSALRTGVARWRTLTQASFELCELPGDHFFLHTHQAELLGAMRRGLS